MNILMGVFSPIQSPTDAMWTGIFSVLYLICIIILYFHIKHKQETGKYRGLSLPYAIIFTIVVFSSAFLALWFYDIYGHQIFMYMLRSVHIVEVIF